MDSGIPNTIMTAPKIAIKQPTKTWCILRLSYLSFKCKAIGKMKHKGEWNILPRNETITKKLGTKVATTTDEITTVTRITASFTDSGILSF